MLLEFCVENSAYLIFFRSRKVKSKHSLITVDCLLYVLTHLMTFSHTLQITFSKLNCCFDTVTVVGHIYQLLLQHIPVEIRKTCETTYSNYWLFTLHACDTVPLNIYSEFVHDVQVHETLPGSAESALSWTALSQSRIALSQ